MTDFIGMIHLAALPGSPQASLPIEQCIDLALRDAAALQAGGVDGVIVENFHDAPFRAGAVDPWTIAVMTRVSQRVRESVSCRLGINVLRNDAQAALAIALAVGADFIRVNIHSGAMLTDQGIITGEADRTLRTRRELGAEQVAIYADVLVKHAVPIGPLRIEDAVADAVERGLADAVIVSGAATGQAAGVEDVQAAVTAASGTPVYVGSGVSARNVRTFIPLAHGLIAGSWIKIDGDVHNPVDVNRVRELRSVLDSLQQTT